MLELLCETFESTISYFTFQTFKVGVGSLQSTLGFTDFRTTESAILQLQPVTEDHGTLETSQQLVQLPYTNCL